MERSESLLITDHTEITGTTDNPRGVCSVTSVRSVITLFGGLLLSLQGTNGPAACALAITNVTVIDGRDSGARRDQTVVIDGNRIVLAGPSRSTRAACGRTIDGTGKFLIPGLWDMHVHTTVVGGRDVLALYIANGVTGVRDMAGEWPTLTRWRAEIAAGQLVGPRIVASGPYLEGGDVPIPHILARTPEEGRAAVDSLVALGADFVKVHGRLSRDTYFAIARRARERGIAFAGHVSQAIGAAAASDSGQRSIEHLLGIPAPCTTAESLALRPRFAVQAALGRCSSRDLTPLYARFVRNETWVTPTFTAAYEIALWPTRALPGDSVAHYLPDTLRRFVLQIFPMPDSIPPGADSVGRAMFAKRLAQVTAMHRAGVRILTGTDAPLRNSPPGFGLHEELTLLARGGLSPFEIVRAATLEAARYLRMTDSLGTIAPGQLADLVLLDADPLRDIGNTRRIVAVIANGRLFDAEARRALLRAAATRPR
jgi:imidazolonepropionase-like amidohydrolase